LELQLVLESRIPLIEPTVELVKSFSRKAGLTKEEAVEFALCANELLTDVVRFAFPKEVGKFVLTLKATPSQVELIVRELGEPFDPDAHPYDPERARKEGKFEGAGIEVIRGLSDGFIFLNKGRAGKEFRIVKKVNAPHITEIFEGREKELLAEPEETTQYCIAPVKPEDAEDVSRLIYRTYRYTYPKEELYYPKKVRQFIESGKKFGVIVRTKEGEAVGYFAVIVKGDSKIGEVGEAVVSPGHRGRGIMKMMMNALIGMAKERGLLGLFGEAITVHTISQRVNAKFGFKSTALMLGTFPEARIVGIREDYGQRISVVIDFLHLIKREKAEVYLPREYSKILREIYQNMGIEVVNRRERRAELPKTSKVELSVNFPLGLAVLVVERPGQDLKERIERKVKKLFSSGIETVYIDLPLDRPEIKKAVKVLRELGFVFSGLMPLFHHGRDYLRLQKVKGSYDFKKIELYSDMAKKIAKRVKRELNEVAQER
jgi:GNAT superfamily N-acetyltransferase/anti-sigma regulatory factor (Ser/Thr protein kinase)